MVIIHVHLHLADDVLYDFIKLTGEDPGCEKGGGAVTSGARSQDFFGQFRGHFKEFGAPPPPLDPRLTDKSQHGGMPVQRCLNAGAALELMAITATAPGQRLAFTRPLFSLSMRAY